MPTVLELYEKLKPKLGEQEARSLLEYIDTSIEHRAATKADLEHMGTALKADLERVATALKAELREEIHGVESGLREAIHRVESSLRQEIERGKSEMIKWSFLFWVGNVAAISGILFALLRAYGPR